MVKTSAVTSVHSMALQAACPVIGNKGTLACRYDADNNGVLACRYDADRHVLVVDLEGRNFLLDPGHVRHNDTSAASIDEWTGERLNKSDSITDDIRPDSIAPLGNYAVQILWQDGFNQVCGQTLYCHMLMRSSCSDLKAAWSELERSML